MPGDRTFLVTGASRGIGHAVAKELVNQGAHCLLLGRDEDALNKAAHEMNAAGGRASVFVFDLELLTSPEQFSSELKKRSDVVDAVLFNAAFDGARLPLAGYPCEPWRKAFQVNVHAVQAMLVAVHPFLLNSAAGRVVFVGSNAARKLKANGGAYAASKAALEAMAGLYAEETRATTIRSNTVSPGPTRTDMRANAYPDEDPSRLKTPEDIAPLFLELLSPDCTHHGSLVDADRWLQERSRLNAA